jgi:hypothetical protein
MFSFLFFPELLDAFVDQTKFVMLLFPIWAFEDFIFNFGWFDWTPEYDSDYLYLGYVIFITLSVHLAIIGISFDKFNEKINPIYIKIRNLVVNIILFILFFEYILWFLLVMFIIQSWLVNLVGYLLTIVVFFFLVLPMLAVLFSTPVILIFLAFVNDQQKQKKDLI